MPTRPYRLYYDRMTSAFIPHVMLEELGVEFELVHVDTGAGEHKAEAFRAINPNMLIPTLSLPDGRTFGENGAQLVMLGDLHPESGMAPQLEDSDRPVFLHWLFAIATTGHTTMRRYSYPEEYTTRRDAEEGTRDASFGQLMRFYSVLDDAISGEPWFLPRGFGPLDIYTILILIPFSGEALKEVLSTRPKLARLHAATHARPTVKRLWEYYFGSDS